MKKIAIVADTRHYAEYLKENISKYMHKYAQFTAYSLENFEKKESFQEKYCVVVSMDTLQRVRKKAGSNMELILISLALSKKQAKMLDAVPRGSKALLVNINQAHCLRTMELIYTAGFNDIELFPYCGAGEYDPSITLAITPNEPQLVPEGIRSVVDLGECVVNMDALYLIAEKIGVFEEFIENEAYQIRENYFSNMDIFLDERKILKENVSMLIQFINEGILLADEHDKIYLHNQAASKLLANRIAQPKGSYTYDIFPELRENKDVAVIKIEDNSLIVSQFELKWEDNRFGNIIFLSPIPETEHKQEISKELSDAPYRTRFTFADIVGESSRIKETIAYAKRISRSNSSILITGESGTGKEVFAQSIHSASKRAGFNFVAVNCAAIPENLLESELFGYVEGSFTGAKRGGKVGLFELAHRGTLFLDEIGEMPLMLQSKLLRALEEHRIMPVGSNTTIPVDVRIIAATNKDLYDMVQKGQFREDLYYRINVLPLKIPSLLDRSEDILPLFYHCINELNTTLVLTQKAEQSVLSHDWKGNVRELRNLSEFLVCQNKKIIDSDDFPPNWTVHIEAAPSNEICLFEAEHETDFSTSLMEKFLLSEGKNLRLHKQVLRILNDSNHRGEKPGRAKILTYAGENPSVTDGDIRYSLQALSAYGFIIAGRGRAGSSISSTGKTLLHHLENDRIGFISAQ